MPSPIGHALAGLAVGYLAGGRNALEPPSAVKPGSPPPRRILGRVRLDSQFVIIVGALVVAAAPDLDLLYPPIHRTVTHSLGATLLLTIVAIAVTRKVTGQVTWRLVLALALAHVSHILLDWMGTDRFPPPGLQVLWPFSRHFYISGWELFPNVERRLWRPDALAVNVRAGLMEILLVGPVALISWLVTRRRRSRVPTFVPDVPRPPFAEAMGTVDISDRPVPREGR